LPLQFTSYVSNCVLNYVNKSAKKGKDKIKAFLENWGRDILKKISVDTVMNQIKYEKRFHRSVKKLYDCSSQVQFQVVFKNVSANLL